MILPALGLVGGLACNIPPSIVRSPKPGVSAKAVVGAPLYEERIVGHHAGDGPFKQQLTYLGNDGRSLTLGYREFLADYARPAFSENVSYSLASGFPLEVSFRAVRITVQSADNNSISYIVGEGFNELIAEISPPPPTEKGCYLWCLPD